MFAPFWTHLHINASYIRKKSLQIRSRMKKEYWKIKKTYKSISVCLCFLLLMMNAFVCVHVNMLCSFTAALHESQNNPSLSYPGPLHSPSFRATFFWLVAPHIKEVSRVRAGLLCRHNHLRISPAHRPWKHNKQQRQSRPLCFNLKWILMLWPLFQFNSLLFLNNNISQQQLPKDISAAPAVIYVHLKHCSVYNHTLVHFSATKYLRLVSLWF